MDESSQFHARIGTLIAMVTHRRGMQEWLVRLGDGTEARAVVYGPVGASLRPGQRVWLNTTAGELDLGTGGAHFIIAPASSAAGSPDDIGAVARRERGHLMKLRYTPLQHAVLSVEEEASPYRLQVEAAQELTGLPVIVAELHSAAMAAAIVAHALAAARVVYVMTDEAALPLAWSRLAVRLREDGVLAGTITAGQAFGGDLEAVTLASALAAARGVLHADVVVVSQGPGNAGTATRYGFSGLAQAEHLNAAAALRARPIATLRISFADPRPRHHGLSHHSATVLGRMTLARAEVAVPELPAAQATPLLAQVRAAGLLRRHQVRLLAIDRLMEAMQPYRELLTTMGRTLEEDHEFFLAAGVAARLAVDPDAGCPWPDPNT